MRCGGARGEVGASGRNTVTPCLARVRECAPTVTLQSDPASRHLTRARAPSGAGDQGVSGRHRCETVSQSGVALGIGHAQLRAKRTPLTSRPEQNGCATAEHGGKPEPLTLVFASGPPSPTVPVGDAAAQAAVRSATRSRARILGEYGNHPPPEPSPAPNARAGRDESRRTLRVRERLAHAHPSASYARAAGESSLGVIARARPPGAPRCPRCAAGCCRTLRARQAPRSAIAPARDLDAARGGIARATVSTTVERCPTLSVRRRRSVSRIV